MFECKRLRKEELLELETESRCFFLKNGLSFLLFLYNTAESLTNTGEFSWTSFLCQDNEYVCKCGACVWIWISFNLLYIKRNFSIHIVMVAVCFLFDFNTRCVSTDHSGSSAKTKTNTIGFKCECLVRLLLQVVSQESAKLKAATMPLSFGVLLVYICFSVVFGKKVSLVKQYHWMSPNSLKTAVTVKLLMLLLNFLCLIENWPHNS